MAKVLLVEDDNNLREIYEARLQAEGYEIVTAKDGEEALVVAKAEKPDLIISDVMMPRVSGFEMLDILRNTEGLKDVKIIMLTALGQAEDKTRADALGADRYLVKSQVTLEDIVKSAQELLVAPKSTPAAPTQTSTSSTPSTSNAPAGHTTTSSSQPASGPANTQPPTPPKTPQPTPPVASNPPVSMSVATPPPAQTPQATSAPVAGAAPVAQPPTPAQQSQVPQPANPGSVNSTSPSHVAPVAPTPPKPPEPRMPNPQTSVSVNPSNSQRMNEPVPKSLTQSTSAEEANVQAQIENFIKNKPTTPPQPEPKPEAFTPPATPTPSEPAPAPLPPETKPETQNTSSSDKLVSDAVNNLVSQTTQPQTPSPEQKAPEPAPATPEKQPPVENNDTVTVAHKKVIKPIDDMSTQNKPDLNELLAKEGFDSIDELPHQPVTPLANNEGGHYTAPPHPPGHVISPSDGSSVDPNSISL